MQGYQAMTSNPRLEGEAGHGQLLMSVKILRYRAVGTPDRSQRARWA
jgi:hypothetical protein